MDFQLAIEEMRRCRINTMNRCTILASCCGHLLFMSQQNVMVGLSSQMLCTEAYTRSNTQFYCYCKYKNCGRVMHITVICMPGFRAELFGRFRCWLAEVLGVQLESTVDISCSRYEYTGELCHFCYFSLDLFAICKFLSSV